jgi:hypothetical protein
MNFIILFLFGLFLNQPSQAQDLSQLDFYSEGRGMHLTPGVLNKVEFIRSVLGGSMADDRILETLAYRYGIQEHNGELVGIKTIRDGKLKIGVLGCVACHSGKAAGQYIIGIGNKNIDPGRIGMDGVKVETAFRKWTDLLAASGLKKKSPRYREIEDSSIRLMQKLADPRMSASTQGLVPVSLVGSWFYEMAGDPIPNHGYKGAVKVPSWFGFEKKLEVGQFADAIGKGHPPGWIIGVEITSGQTPEAVRAYFPKVEKAVSMISALKPPQYPFSIHVERAARGKITFEKTCAKCHGTYEFLANGDPVYKVPKIIPLEKIGTDSDRLDYVTPDFLDHVQKSPLSDLIQLSEYAGKRMYVAPRLHGIWARFPYLHNGSVPTLRDLLEPASKRPKLFSLEDAGEKIRFDPVRGGLTMPKTSTALTNLIEDYQNHERWIYDTSLQGQSNQGHEKFLDLQDFEKDEIVEYLKTL